MNNTKFESIVEILGNLIDQQKARFIFENDSTSLQIKSKFTDNDTINIEPNELNSILNEIVQITTKILNNYHLPEVNYQGDPDYLQKVMSVRNKIINNKLVRRYQFYTGPVINPFKSFSMNPIIKPGINGQSNLTIVNFLLEYSDVSGKNKKINVEMNIDHIENLITGLEQMRDMVKELDQKVKGYQFVEEIN